MKQFALVTGASRGLGRAAATYLSRKGYTVILTSRDSQALERVRSELQGENHQIVEADVSTDSGLERLASFVEESVGDLGLKIFVHCAASTPNPDQEASLSDTDGDTLEAHLRATARPAMYLLKMLKPVLGRNPRSHAILISSDWVIDGITGPPAFAASKAFAAAIWRNARLEFLRDGIVLSTIIPGNVATYDESWENAKWTIDDTTDSVQAELGLSRISIPDVIAVVDLIVSAPLAAVTEVRLVPLDPEYVP
jgi:NAD(P)-dependent dehydrogenase (short-subunit alcohol dehydrogenase family)